MTRAFALGLAAACALLLVGRGARADEDTTPDAHDHPRPGLGGHLTLGGDYGRLLSIPISGPSASLALGSVVSRDTALYVGGSYELGASQYGLRVHQGTVDATAQQIIGRLRLGLGVDLLYLSIVRVSESTALDRIGLGAHAWASVDLWKDANHGVFVGAKPEADWLDPHLMWRVGAFLGARM